MNLDFSRERWQKVKEDSIRWWAGELDRPLIHMTLEGRDPGRPAPALPYHWFTSFYDMSITPEQIVDMWDYYLSCNRFMGDAFPNVCPYFGAGVTAAFLGARLENGKDTTWFHPSELRDLSDLRLEYDPDNVWLRRVKDVCRAAMERWEGMVQVGMTDLGGAVDVASTFRPGTLLLLDLYDNPEEVKRLVSDIHELWWKYFDELNDILQPVNPGYTAWTPIFSTEPYYMLQCDFCYMIGPDMFDEFVKPELAASCRKMPNAFYHLDGPGELPHLDSLLSIPDLKGIQWIPGAGQPGETEWPEVYRKVRDAGKLIQLWGDMKTLDTIAEQLGSSKGIVIVTSAQDEQTATEFLGKYRAA